MIRIPYLKNLANTADFLGATLDTAIWTIVEAGLGLTAGGAATLRPLCRKFLDRSSQTPQINARSSDPWSRSDAYLPSGNQFVPISKIRSDTAVMIGNDSPLQEFGEGEAAIRVLRTVDITTAYPESDDGRSEERAVKMKNSWDTSIAQGDG
jgi:hypothetical protein